MKRSLSGVDLLSASVFLVVLCGAEIYGVLPFGAPAYCALAAFSDMRRESGATGRNGIFLGYISAVYILLSFLFTFEVWRLYLCSAVVFIMLFRWFLSLKSAKLDRRAVRYAFSVGAIVTAAALSCIFEPIASAAVCGMISVSFLYIAALAAGCISSRLAFRLSAPEAASVCVVLAVAGITFGRAVWHGVCIGLGFSYFAVLLLCITGAVETLAGGAAIAIGLGSTDIVTGFCFLGAVAACAVFRVLPRPAYALAGTGVFAAFCVLFGMPIGALGWNVLSLFCGGALFCLIRRRAVRALGEYFDFDGSARLAVRHYINRVKADAGNRLFVLSSVFDETARLINAFVEPPPDIAAAGGALSDRICPYCARSDCDKERRTAAFCAVAERAYSGRSVLTDMPEFFTDECAKTAEVLTAAGALSSSVREKLKRAESEDRARAIVTERLAAIKDVLAELGRSEAAPVGFDGEAERRVAFELMNRGIECAEAFVTRAGVTAIVRSAAADREKVRRAVSLSMKGNYEVTSLERTQASGWSVAVLKKRPLYEAVYARAGVSKNGGVSGDSYTFERIGDRFLAALFDGMGSGSAASMGSGSAIELIECFYRAGFDSTSALSGVNRFLKMPGGENFSAADVAVCDLCTASVDIIKMGAPPCYIKTADTVLKVEGGSLPMGVLDEMRPYVTTKRLYPGQMLIMVSDGVSDCFSGDELPEYINGLGALNPARTAEEILLRALKLVGDVPRDDMTVVAFRLCEAKRK